MGAVLEFEFARARLSREMLRIFGVEGPLRWTCAGLPRQSFCFRGLDARPIVAESSCRKRVRLVFPLAGRTRARLTSRELVNVVLDVAVVRSVLARQRGGPVDVSAWCTFDDRGRLEIDVPPWLAAEWRDRAIHALRSLGVAQMSTAALAERVDTDLWTKGR